MGFPDNSFDLVWACESGEHMPDKKKCVIFHLSRWCFACPACNASQSRTTAPPRCLWIGLAAQPAPDLAGCKPANGRYVEEMVRVLKPGGRLVIATWCQRQAWCLPLLCKRDTFILRLVHIFFFRCCAGHADLALLAYVTPQEADLVGREPTLVAEAPAAPWWS